MCDVEKELNNASNSVSKAIGTDGSGGGVLGEVDKLGKNIGSAWHDVSAPFVDTPLGRMVLRAGATAFGGPWGAAAVNAGLGVNDAANGRSRNNLANLFNTGFSVYNAMDAPYTPSATDYAQGGPSTGVYGVPTDAQLAEMGVDKATWINESIANGLGERAVEGASNAITLNGGLDKLNDWVSGGGLGRLGDKALDVGKNVGAQYLTSQVPGLGTAMSLYKGTMGPEATRGENLVRGLGSMYFENQPRGSTMPSPPPITDIFGSSTAPSQTKSPFNIGRVNTGRKWIIQRNA